MSLIFCCTCLCFLGLKMIVKGKLKILTSSDTVKQQLLLAEEKHRQKGNLSLKR